jgi:hypothetical protein
MCINLKRFGFEVAIYTSKPEFEYLRNEKPLHKGLFVFYCSRSASTTDPQQARSVPKQLS